MGLFDQFPYTNFHELNLDWILRALKELEHTIDQFVAINALKYADPIQWNITSQYEKNTIVIDPQTGTAYISVQPVPIGVALTNPDYWTVVFDLGSFVVRAAKNLANTYEADTTLTATVNTPAGGWLVWGDTLYKALVNITAGDSYVEDSNIEHFTIEEVIGHLEDLNTTDKSNLVAAINEEVQARINAVTTLQGNIDAEALARQNADATLQGNINAEALARQNADATLQGNINTEALARQNADATLQGNIDAEALARQNADATLRSNIGVLSNLNTTDKSNLVAAINEVLGGTVVSRRIITIADSYGYHPDASTSWQAKLVNIFPSGTFYNYYEGSMGIYHQGSSGHNVEQLIAYHAPSIPDHDGITDIVIALGINDYQDTLSNVASAYDSLITYCHNTFPKAMLHFGFAGYTHALINAALVANYKNLIALMMEKSASGRAKFISNMEYIMHDLTNNESDLVHPNNKGSAALAEAVNMSLIGGTYHYRNTLRSDVTSGSGATVANAMVQTIDDNMTVIKCENVYNSNALAFVGADFTTFATIANPLVYNANIQMYTSIFSNDTSAPPAMTAITSGGTISLSYTGAGTRTVNGVQLNRFMMVGNTLDM